MSPWYFFYEIKLSYLRQLELVTLNIIFSVVPHNLAQVPLLLEL